MIILWHYRDLRLQDNEALYRALEQSDKILPLFIYSPKEENPDPQGSASKWWLHHSLVSLKKDYQKRGADLLIKEGSSQKILDALIKKYPITGIYWNRRYEPALRKRDAQILKAYPDLDIQIFNGNYLIDPDEVKTKTGKPFTVYTPFWKTAHKLMEHRSLFPSPKKLIKVPLPASDKLDLLPHFHWADSFTDLWQPGRQGALKQLKSFLAQKMKRYDHMRDFPAEEGTSKLSPHLHFGEISPHEIASQLPKGQNAERYLMELFWREFGNYTLYHFPDFAHKNWKPQFDKFPWKKSPSLLKKWQKGLTGYPIVDAGMRELWKTGWMNNRVRMIVASFLIKDLIIDWREGEKWFWDTLVDADLASNALGWQWVAGSGPDAAPYFRIFNPLLQSQKFDPHGDYIRHYVPELHELPDEAIHAPYEASPEVLERAGIHLGRDYPYPIVDHGKARQEALSAFKKIKA